MLLLRYRVRAEGRFALLGSTISAHHPLGTLTRNAAQRQPAWLACVDGALVYVGLHDTEHDDRWLGWPSDEETVQNKRISTYRSGHRAAQLTMMDRPPFKEAATQQSETGPAFCQFSAVSLPKEVVCPGLTKLLRGY
jgi:hypothetical protein